MSIIMSVDEAGGDRGMAAVGLIVLEGVEEELEESAVGAGSAD